MHSGLYILSCVFPCLALGSFLLCVLVVIYLYVAVNPFEMCRCNVRPNDSLHPLSQHIRRQWCIVRRADLEYSIQPSVCPLLWSLRCQCCNPYCAHVCKSATMTQFSHWCCQACPWWGHGCYGINLQLCVFFSKSVWSHNLQLYQGDEPIILYLKCSTWMFCICTSLTGAFKSMYSVVSNCCRCLWGLGVHLFKCAHSRTYSKSQPLAELFPISRAFLLILSIPLIMQLPTCSPLRACVCRHTLLGACLTFFQLHNTKAHRHTCSSSAWASIKKKKNTSLFPPFFSLFSFFSSPSFAFFLKLAWGLAEPHQLFALARLHTGILCDYLKWLN